MEIMTADRIKALRLALGMTLAEFAAELGVSISAVSWWENNRSHPRFPVMERVSKLAEDFKAGRKKPPVHEPPAPRAPVRRGPRHPKEAHPA